MSFFAFGNRRQKGANIEFFVCHLLQSIRKTVLDKILPAWYWRMASSEPLQLGQEDKCWATMKERSAAKQASQGFWYVVFFVPISFCLWPDSKAVVKSRLGTVGVPPFLHSLLSRQVWRHTSGAIVNYTVIN
jgi:hypothetical protein